MKIITAYRLPKNLKKKNKEKFFWVYFIWKIVQD